MRGASQKTIPAWPVWGCLVVIAALSGCGGTAGSSTTGASTAASVSAKTDPPTAPKVSPPAVKTATEKTPGGRVDVAEVADPEEAKSFPTSAGAVHHKTAKTPAKAGAVIAAGAPSDAEVQRELNEMHAVEHTAQQTHRKELTPVPGGESVGGNGTITPPPGIPAVVARVIAGGNAIADFPYVFGGGHGSFVDNAYDCSGSVSYALAAGGLLSAPLVSGDLAHWGEPGPGRWITIYANAGHTFMDVDGMWFDTAGRSGPYASRWLVAQPSLEGYAVRHPQGL
jgi:cell wall-associated NlpC family hydrolase